MTKMQDYKQLLISLNGILPEEHKLELEKLEDQIIIEEILPDFIDLIAPVLEQLHRNINVVVNYEPKQGITFKITRNELDSGGKKLPITKTIYSSNTSDDDTINDIDAGAIDLSRFQEETNEMVSQLEFVKMVDVQSETIDRYIKERKIKSDKTVLIAGNRTLHYFTVDSVRYYANKFGWSIIDPQNIKNKFMDFIRKMDMCYSYKPVFILSLLDSWNIYGKAKINDIVDAFIKFYKNRQKLGLVVEKPNSIFCRQIIDKTVARQNILKNPYKRFADMNFLEYSKDSEYIAFNKDIHKNLSCEDYEEIRTICYQKLDDYYSKLG